MNNRWNMIPSLSPALVTLALAFAFAFSPAFGKSFALAFPLASNTIGFDALKGGRTFSTLSTSSRKMLETPGGSVKSTRLWQCKSKILQNLYKDTYEDKDKYKDKDGVPSVFENV